MGANFFEISLGVFFENSWLGNFSDFAWYFHENCWLDYSQFSLLDSKKAAN
jgi:hypothetical protein